jgi:hypothetical protein
MLVITAAFLLGAASIAGIPPLNGYVSVSLIHQGLQQQHETIPYLLTLAAQAITIAALGRAAWLAFVSPAQDGQARGIQLGEQLRPGMLAGLISLGACCVAFGAAGPVVLRRLMAPAAASLLNPGRYASGVLAGSGRLPVLHIPFDYASPGELGARGGHPRGGRLAGLGLPADPRTPGDQRAARHPYWLGERLRGLRDRRDAGRHHCARPGLTGRGCVLREACVRRQAGRSGQ